MSVDFGRFWTIDLLNVPSAVEFSVCRGVSICGWSISLNIFCMMTPPFELRYRSVISALAAYDIIFYMMVDTTCAPPFFIIVWPSFCLFVKKNFTPTQLKTFGLDNCEASLCISIIMSLFFVPGDYV